MEKEEQAKKTAERSEKIDEKVDATMEEMKEEEEVVTATKDVTSPAPVAEKPKGKPTNLNFILDIPLEVTVELGRSRMIINDLLQLGQGSVIELTKLAGEPLEILVNQKLIARGEVVVVNEKFGVRLTDIISPIERVEQLG